jgi:hypothetical protein
MSIKAGQAHPDVADASLGAAQSEVAGEVTRLVGSAEGGGEHKPGVPPDITSPCAVSGLPLGPELERGQADIRKRKNRFGTGCLGFAVEQLAA